MEPENTDTNESMMDHTEAARLDACNRYLVGDLSPSEAEAFEEHFFSCPECAEEVRLGDLLRRHVRESFETQPRGLEPGRPWWNWLDRFAPYALPAIACLILAVVVYQNVLVIPRLRTRVAALTAAQPVALVALKLDRGTDSVVIPRDNGFWMAYFNLPNPRAYSSYKCEIERNGAATIKTVKFPAPAPGLPSSILLRRSDFPSGSYAFRIIGEGSTTPVVTYTIELNTD